MADQLRFDWLSVVGTPGVRTPNIDRLAERGIRLTHAVTNAAICVPARIALATGQSPERLETLDNHALLPESAGTYYQHFRDHGYHVGTVGKLDLAKSHRDNGARGDRPSTFTWGFTHPVEAEGKVHAGRASAGEPLGPYGTWLEDRGLLKAFSDDYANRFGWDNPSNGTPSYGREPRYVGDGLYRSSALPDGAFEDEWIGARAIQWLDTVPAEFPWYLFVSFVGPHDPYDPPASWSQRFENAPMPEPIPSARRGKPSRVSPGPWQLGAEEILQSRRQYTASLAVIDDQIGRLLDKLEERGVVDDTLVAFTADHGEMLGDHGLFQKSVPYEASIRVPLILAGPGVPSTTSDELVQLGDLHPSLCELASVPAMGRTDARSFVGPPHDRSRITGREVVLCSERHYMTLRSRTYKYVANFGPRGLQDDVPEELYDLTADPTEQENLFVEDAARARKVRDLLIDQGVRSDLRLGRLAAALPA